MSISDDKIINLPDTFRPVGSAALQVVHGLRAKTVETLEREATELENAARLKRFAAEQIKKGAAR